MMWLLVLAAAAAEIAGVIGLKKFSQHKTWPRLAGFCGGFSLSFILLYVAFLYLPVSAAYAVWIGTGTAGAVLVNIWFFGENKTPGRLAGLALIIIGVAGVKWLS